MKGYPKIFHLGTPQLDNILQGTVEITEKIDGSAFAFGWNPADDVDDAWNFHMRSKNTAIQIGAPNDMFKIAHDFALEMCEIVPMGYLVYGEYLQRPKHNTLAYDRVPHSHFAIYAIHDTKNDVWLDHEGLQKWAWELGCECVQLLFQGELDELHTDKLDKYLETESQLGGVTIEGVVVKNLALANEYKGLIYPVTAGKYVSEAFKEKNKADWKKSNTSGGQLQTLFSMYHNEARWKKAIQARRDSGAILWDPKDIGPLIADIHDDIETEEKDFIKGRLWAIFKRELFSTSTRGFPEFYKRLLVDNAEEIAEKEGVTVDVKIEDIKEPVLPAADEDTPPEPPAEPDDPSVTVIA